MSGGDEGVGGGVTERLDTDRKGCNLILWEWMSLKNPPHPGPLPQSRERVTYFLPSPGFAGEGPGVRGILRPPENQDAPNRRNSRGADAAGVLFA